MTTSTDKLFVMVTQCPKVGYDCTYPDCDCNPASAAPTDKPAAARGADVSDDPARCRLCGKHLDEDYDSLSAELARVRGELLDARHAAMERGMRAEQAERKAGWVAVSEPTQEMLDAGHTAIANGDGLRVAYKAMLSAALAGMTKA